MSQPVTSHHSDTSNGLAHSPNRSGIPPGSPNGEQKLLSTHTGSGIHHRRSDSVGEALARHESIRDAQSLASIDRPPSDDESLPPSKIYHPLSIPVLALLVPASIFGVLARLGLQALVTYDGQSIFPLAYIQATGCFIMGIGLGVKEPFGNFYGPLYTAMTTGFCGSLTTFSGWQVDVFNSWINMGQYHRNGLRDLVDGVTKTVFTLVVSLASISFGARVARILTPHLPTLSPPPRYARYSLTVFSVLVYAGAFPGYFRLSEDYRHQATAALLFAFPGTLTRYLFSIRLNPVSKLFPLGTFTANSFGTALLGTIHVLQNMRTPVSPNACAILQGLGDGYCGCLTTVSTFAAEVSTMEEWKAWFYVTISWMTGQLLLLVIMGSSFWAGHVKEQQTCRFV